MEKLSLKPTCKIALVNDILDIKNQLKIRGYAVINLPKGLNIFIQEAKQDLINFFAMSKERKNLYTQDVVFGYNQYDHKEVLRFMTGHRAEFLENVYGLTCTKILLYSLDVEMSLLVDELFPNIKDKLKDKLPFITLEESDNGWGLFDSVYYNNTVQRKDDLNVVEHFDAGLLTLSFISTEKGLQFRNEHNEWIDLHHSVDSATQAILWTGNAVKSYDDSFSVGVHRVTISDKPRLACWYEVCTYEQERKDLRENKHIGYAYELELMEKEGYLPVRNEEGYITTFQKIDNISTPTTVRYQNDTDTGSPNKFIGFRLLEENTTGSGKVAVGSRALVANITGININNVVATGFDALNNI